MSHLHDAFQSKASKQGRQISQENLKKKEKAKVKLFMGSSSFKLLELLSRFIQHE